MSRSPVSARSRLATLDYIFKRQLSQARRVHADDPALTFITVSSDGGFLPAQS